MWWTFMIQAWISQQITEMWAHKHHFVLGLEIHKSHPQHFLGKNPLYNFIFSLIFIKSFGSIAIIYLHTFTPVA